MKLYQFLVDSIIHRVFVFVFAKDQTEACKLANEKLEAESINYYLMPINIVDTQDLAEVKPGIFEFIDVG